MEDENCNNGLFREPQPIAIIETSVAQVIASNVYANVCTQAQAADTTTALGIWKRYLPNTELDRPDILGKFYKEFGYYKFTNLVEETGAVGVGNIVELVGLYGKMQHSGDIRRPRAKRLEFRRRKAIDYSGFDVNTSSSEDGELIDLKEPKIRLLTFEILLKCMRQLCIACMSLELKTALVATDLMLILQMA